MFAVLSCLLLLVTNIAHGDTVRLKRSTVVADTAEVVRLHDTAELSGAEVLGVSDLTIITTEELRRRGKFMITLDDIRQALASRRMNLGRIAFSGETCEVHFAAGGEVSSRRQNRLDEVDEGLTKEVVPGEWASAVIGDGTLRGQIARLITTRVHQQSAETVRLIFAERDKEKLELSALIHDFEIIPQGTKGSAVFPVQVRVFAGDKFLRSFRINVGIRLQMKVYIAQRYIARGEMIRPGDFIIENKLMSPNPIPAETTSRKVTGLEARGRIVRGTVLRAGELTDPISVRRNQSVTLVIKRGQFVLSLKGIALEKGRVGDVIGVQPGMSSRVLKARIDPEGILTVLSE